MLTCVRFLVVLIFPSFMSMSSLKQKHSSAAGSELKKRKHVMLTISKKLKIFELASSDMSYSAISKWYGIGRSTIVGIRKNEQAMHDFKRKSWK